MLFGYKMNDSNPLMMVSSGKVVSLKRRQVCVSVWYGGEEVGLWGQGKTHSQLVWTNVIFFQSFPLSCGNRNTLSIDFILFKKKNASGNLENKVILDKKYSA